MSRIYASLDLPSRKNDTIILEIRPEYQEKDCLKPRDALIEPRGPGRPRSERARRDILEAAYKLLKKKEISSIGAYEIAKEAGVGRATLYRWWDSKEAVIFEACLEHLKLSRAPVKGSPLARLRDQVLRSTDWIHSEEGDIMARVITGIHGDRKLQQLYLEKFYLPRREMQIQMVKDAIASGELKPNTNPGFLLDALFGPVFFRWLQGHAAVDKPFVRGLVDQILQSFVA
jgi:AcrR family transcriptional regulator